MCAHIGGVAGCKVVVSWHWYSRSCTSTGNVRAMRGTISLLVHVHSSRVDSGTNSSAGKKRLQSLIRRFLVGSYHWRNRRARERTSHTAIQAARSDMDLATPQCGVCRLSDLLIFGFYFLSFLTTVRDACPAWKYVCG